MIDGENRRRASWKHVAGGASVVFMALLFVILPVRASSVAETEESLVQQSTTIDSDDARKLAELFSPIIMVRTQSEPCDTIGEPYLPVPVDLVFGIPDVRLRENGGGSRQDDPVLMTAPTADDLIRAGADTYLDFPGNPRSSRCTYEEWFKGLMPAFAPTIYARVAEADTGKVVIQYHFYYVFNDFNNTHESDWEMAQLVFDEPTVAEALSSEPVQVAYAQHGGGETAEWDDDKLLRERSHIVVHSSSGSHALQFQTETYLGWGANGTGFGCDNTQDPVERVKTKTVLLTTDPERPGSDQGWLAWAGRWGERQPWEYNGPLGPATTFRWADPVGWQSELRDSSIYVPGTSQFGPGPTDVFCDATEFGSRMLTFWAVEPWAVASIVMIPTALFLSLFLLARRTMIAAFHIYRRHLRAFAGIGLLLIPIGIVANGVQYLILEYPLGREIDEVMRFTPIADFAVAMSVGSAQQIVSLLVVVPAVLELFREVERGEAVSVRGVLRGTRSRFVAILRAGVSPIGKVLLAAATIIGIPWAIDRSVRWGFIPHAVVLSGTDPQQAAARSAVMVRGKWWRTAGIVIVVGIVAAAPGPILGILLLITASASVGFVNMLSSVLYAIALPFSVLSMAILYRQREVQTRSAPDSMVDIEE